MIPSELTLWPAPAKLNLFLHITARRPDGYHELQTIFQLLDFGDEMAFEITEDGKISRATDLPGVPEKSDITVKAALALKAHCAADCGVKIYLRKKLPMGGGVGGGSTDAATTLVALNRLWECGLLEDELAEIGAGIGADVPVFLRGKSAWAEGIGEILRPVVLPSQHFLVIKPPVHVSTADLFADSRLTRNCHTITIRDFFAGGTRNVFEPLVRDRYPEVDKALHWLAEFAPARLTGTGACVFAAFADRLDAEKAMAGMPETFTAFIARGVNDSPLLNV